MGLLTRVARLTTLDAVRGGRSGRDRRQHRRRVDGDAGARPGSRRRAIDMWNSDAG